MCRVEKEVSTTSKNSLGARDVVGAGLGFEGSKKRVKKVVTNSGKRTHKRTREVWMCSSCSGQESPLDKEKRLEEERVLEGMEKDWNKLFKKRLKEVGISEPSSFTQILEELGSLKASARGHKPSLDRLFVLRAIAKSIERVEDAVDDMKAAEFSGKAKNLYKTDRKEASYIAKNTKRNMLGVEVFGCGGCFVQILLCVGLFFLFKELAFDASWKLWAWLTGGLVVFNLLSEKKVRCGKKWHQTLDRIGEIQRGIDDIIDGLESDFFLPIKLELIKINKDSLLLLSGSESDDLDSCSTKDIKDVSPKKKTTGTSQRKNIKKKVEEKVDDESSKKETLKQLATKLYADKKFFGMATYLLMKQVALADGEISQDEESLMAERINLSVDCKRLADEFWEMKNSDVILIKMIIKGMRNEPGCREALVSNLFSMAEANGEIKIAEMNVIKKVAKEIGLDEEFLASLCEKTETTFEMTVDSTPELIDEIFDDIDFDDN
jgi:uncharacterized tellurite resistance protein B-like protein